MTEHAYCIVTYTQVVKMLLEQDVMIFQRVDGNERGGEKERADLSISHIEILLGELTCMPFKLSLSCLAAYDKIA
jgi:hypothetical protein